MSPRISRNNLRNAVLALLKLDSDFVVVMPEGSGLMVVVDDGTKRAIQMWSPLDLMSSETHTRAKLAELKNKWELQD